MNTLAKDKSPIEALNLGVQVGAYLNGTQAASRFLFMLTREYKDPDELSREIVKAHAAGEDHLLGYARTIQKSLEKALGPR